MSTQIPPPLPRQLLPALLASLPAAAISTQPPTALLPLLSPILRQRVQLLSASSKEPWLSLLCYDSEKSSKLDHIAKTDRFEPHPVSGEVEVDWDYEVNARYKRVDEETLHTLVLLREFELGVRLVWCVGDQEGGGDGWRIGEVSVLDLDDAQWGAASVAEAESSYKAAASTKNSSTLGGGSWQAVEAEVEAEAKGTEDDDDDAYWAQYDNPSAPTPVQKHSPAPNSMQNTAQQTQDDDEAYFAQYAQVQPAMDNHDPDEAQENGTVESTLGQDDITTGLLRRDLANQQHSPSPSPPYAEEYEDVMSPRPGSSTGSNGEVTVAKLERTAERQGQSEIGVKQHIGTSIKSLYRLAKAAGMGRAEFERLVRTELDVLSMMDDDDDE